MDSFDFERLDVFVAAVEMVARVDAIADGLPKGRAYMKSQLRRAANSVVLNIAEGAGEFAPAEKARFYRMARRSATETAAQVIVADRLELAKRADVLEVRKLLHRLVAMLIRLASSAEARSASSVHALRR